MGLVEAVKSVFGNYATFSGRARRSEYWFFYLFNLIAVFVFMIVASIIGAIFGGGKGAAGGLAVGYVLYILYGLAAFIPSLAVAVRRLHDTNRSGWNLLWCLLPFVGGIVVLVFMVMDSTPGENQYGANPKAIETYNLPLPRLPLRGRSSYL